jgi:NAD(P)-dependent dehydrogenase (short-subunit alcohol dehydrogenase family)
MGILDGQVAIVTGAGRGFGRAIAMHLAAEGACVTVSSRTREELDETVRLIETAGGEAYAVSGDVTSRKDAAHVVAETVQHFGKLTLLVSNAGVPDPFGPLGAVDPDQWWDAQAVHIRGPLLFIHETLPAMKVNGEGRIIIVSAFGGTVVAPYMSAYCVGKAVQIRLAEFVDAEYREQGIRAFSIDPGFVFTELAQRTLDSPDAQRWLPDMMIRLEQKKQEPDSDRDLERCGRRCVDLASGRFDALSGKYMTLEDEIEVMLSKAENKNGS